MRLTTPPGEEIRFSTTLRSRDFFVISLINGLLNIVTLTLYRFWGKTEVRRRIWRGVRVNDEAFEYTGRGMDLFLGFLIAVVVLGLPFLAIVFGIQFLQAQWLTLLIFPLYAVAFWLFGFGMFTAFRYLASRTTWRGVRFRLAGSASTYAWTYFGMLIGSSMTAGWIWPLAERTLTGQIWGSAYFGDRRFGWNVGRSERIGIYGPFAVGWFGTLVLYLVAVFGFVGLMMASGMGEDIRQAQPGDQPPLAFFFYIYGYMLAVLPLFALVWAPYQSAKLRSFAEGISLDEARFQLDVGSMSLWWLTCSNVVLLVVSFGLLMPLVQARCAKFIVRRLKARGTAQLDAAHQAPQGPRTAEGLADAFGFSFI